MRQSRTRSLGLDVQQEAIAVAYVAPEHGAEVTSLGPIGTRPCDLDQRIRTLHAQAQPLIVVYDAGPWGHPHEAKR